VELDLAVGGIDAEAGVEWVVGGFVDVQTGDHDGDEVQVGELGLGSEQVEAGALEQVREFVGDEAVLADVELQVLAVRAGYVQVRNVPGM